MGPLRAGHKIRIDSIRLHGADRGVALLGAVLYDGRDGMVGVERHFPPTTIHLGDAKKPQGAVVAGTGTMLLIGLAARKLGGFHVRGVDVRYHDQWNGIDLERHAHIGVEVYFCVTRASVRDAACTDANP